jgi:putative tryptophan/tyrosine transport system substrate-binding protein
MRRRDFITLLGGAAAWPLAARAQQPKGMRRIGDVENSIITESNSKATDLGAVFDAHVKAEGFNLHLGKGPWQPRGAGKINKAVLG